ncbi:D-alanyl-D-alanine carboxypeptidase [Paenibacillus sp. J5C_2022]|uniref:D-alanyl-D-alanine carboxypeptidase family protein n=1 Tax=Paenibacillus sp. J5C2022 TaxID=2977129 RepID=UPI0021D0DDE6|nr:D-alanyl-D-alanine carboxypeptidase family protein [Paenibacillus sp. J5C2022]MCU6709639.1 D-alanyl-D-alanine carboxypeptidase [Paenibacillus sp. J5C2022]
MTRYERENNGRWNAVQAGMFLLVIFLLYTGLTSIRAESGEAVVSVDARAAVLLDADTGEVLFQQNADKALPPASMSKMMTELIVLDEVESESIRWSDKVRVSAYAAAVPGARMGLLLGDELTVRELFDAMTVHSANDAAVALAEHIAGSESAFVRRMNERAREIGLSDDTLFGNASGLGSEHITHLAGASAERDTVMTAMDTALLGGFLIGKYPEVLVISSMPSVKVSTQSHPLAATNLMLANKPFSYPGNNGLKTGYTPSAGYCFTGTVSRDGRRVISVVMGAASAEKRFVETKKLYELVF